MKKVKLTPEQKEANKLARQKAKYEAKELARTNAEMLTSPPHLKKKLISILKK